MTAEDKKRRAAWGGMLLIGALGCASMRNNPAWGMAPLAIGIIEAGIYACLLAAVQFAYWHTAAVIGVAAPIYLWSMRFLDGFMIPADILVGLVLTAGMCLLLRKKQNYWMGVIMLTAAGFAATMLGSAAAIWIVKQQSLVRSFLTAWNTEVYSVIGILAAALVCVPRKYPETEE